MKETVIASAVRTPFGTYGGSLKDVPAVNLGAIAIREAVKRAGVDPEKIDYLFMGMVVQAGAGQVPSRQAGLKAGLPPEVPSDTINKVCASSLRAVNLGDALIRAGDARIVVAGGMESMSRTPYILEQARWGYRLGHAPLVDAMVKDGLWCPACDCHMGVLGHEVAKEFGITREEQDRWALRSHQRAIAAIDSGKFKDETTPVEIPQRKGPPAVFAVDEHPRRDTSLEKLAALKPAFQPDGTVTAGNAPGLNDGGAAIVLLHPDVARAMGIKPLATIVAQGQASVQPRYLNTVPAVAARAALERAGLKAEDMDLIEVNEAFAAVALTAIKVGEWDPEKVNVNGGAVALGHPIGASGARILMTLIYELRRRGGGLGLATICSGMAQGEATIVRVEP
ncbi:MAG: acetyl-CoA C-acetyltransferase [Acetobacteraceae bacterium]|nr:acetyl-CoA C-acetyltransferase [Acetobacteraceae bacterium]